MIRDARIRIRSPLQHNVATDVNSPMAPCKVPPRYEGIEIHVYAVSLALLDVVMGLIICFELCYSLCSFLHFLHWMHPNKDFGQLGRVGAMPCVRYATHMTYGKELIMHFLSLVVSSRLHRHVSGASSIILLCFVASFHEVTATTIVVNSTFGATVF